jgi:hypothetical protein
MHKLDISDKEIITYGLSIVKEAIGMFYPTHLYELYRLYYPTLFQRAGLD